MINDGFADMRVVENGLFLGAAQRCRLRLRPVPAPLLGPLEQLWEKAGAGREGTTQATEPRSSSRSSEGSEPPSSDQRRRKSCLPVAECR